MTTVDFITELFYRVDDDLGDTKHPLAGGGQEVSDRLYS